LRNAIVLVIARRASVTAFVGATTALAAAVFWAAPASAVDGSAPPQVAIVVPLTVPAAESGLIGSSVLEEYTAPGGLLAQRLDAVIDRPVTLAIDPMIIVSIRILGSEAPANALAWLDRLRGASNETFALAFADADLTLALQSGSAVMPAPIGFDYALVADRFGSAVDPVTEPTASPNPTSTADPDTPGDPTLPTLTELLEWPYTLSAAAWPVMDTVTTPDLAALVARETVVTLLAESNVQAPAESGSAIRVNGASAIVIDSSVSEALQETIDAQTADAWQQSLQAFTSAIAAENARQSGRQATIVATLDRAAGEAGARLSETLAAVETQPSIALVPLSAVLDAPATNANLVESAQPADRLALARTLISEEQLDTQFSTIVDNQSTITAERRNRLLALLSADWVRIPDEWSSAAQTFAVESAELRGSVQIVDVSNINFFTDRQSIQIPVSNRLDVPVRVLVTVTAQRPLLFIEQSPIELVIEPNSQKNAPVPVQSVSNGTVQLTVTLASATGVPIGEPNRVSVNVQAGWETPVVTAVGVLAVAVFVIGLIRNISRRRKQPRV